MDVGVEFSHYRVIEHIGRGGMADVWSARDKMLNRTVAIKTMMRDLSHDLDPVRLFEQEAQTIAQLEHPHILPIYEFGNYDNQLFIVMRYVSGGSLEDLVESGALSTEDTLRLARGVAQALDYAHRSNVVHLDIKPSNILLDSYTSPYLADFGLAAVLGPEGRAHNPGSGTLLYMAPEQLTSDQIDHRADVYSFTVLLFHLLTGQLPFDATTPLALKQLQFQEELPEVEYIAPSLPAALTDVLRQGTAPEPGQRPESIMELMGDVERLLSPSRVAAPVVARPSGAASSYTPDADADLGDLLTQPSASPEAQALREAQDIYNRARRAWAYGQGRFLLGVTHFMLINDFYMNAAANNLELDEAGIQVLLRGAIEYDHEIDYWWSRLSDDSRRWVCLHAVRSENAPARKRAIERLANLPDDVGVIPRQVAQAIQVETNEAALLAGLDTLAVRARRADQQRQFDLDSKAQSRTTQVVSRLTSQLKLTAPDEWREVAFAPEIDLLLADIALTSPFHAVAERAARTIGRISSLTAVREIAEQQRQGAKGALRALAFIRDESTSLPNVVSPRARLYAWLANTWRRLSDRPMQIVWRYVLALLGALFAVGLNTYITFRSESFLNPLRWKVTVSVGLVTAVLVGFLVLVADELPGRLRGFWPWWARLLLSVALGLVGGTAAWGVYTYLYLEYPPENVTYFAAAGIAFGLVASTMFRLPGWLAFLVTAIATYIPLYVAFQNYLPPILYYDSPEQILVLGLPVAILIALGMHAQALMRDVRRLLKRA